MKELISIEKQKIGNDTVNAVNARELHEFLEVETQFSIWIQRRIKEYNFTENIDFITIIKNDYSPPLKEYTISIDMAKELSMVERNEKGKEARKYFIECERKLKEDEKFKIPQTYPEALRLAADQQELIERQGKEIKEAKPKVEYVDRVLNSPSLVTTTQIAKDYGLSAVRLNEILHENGVQFKQSGQWFLYQHLSDKGLTQSETAEIKKKDGTIKVVMNTKWTSVGRRFIHYLLKDMGILLNTEKLQKGA